MNPSYMNARRLASFRSVHAGGHQKLARRAVHLEMVSKLGTRWTITSRSSFGMVNELVKGWVPSGVVILPETRMTSEVLLHLPDAETTGPCVNVNRPSRNMVYLATEAPETLDSANTKSPESVSLTLIDPRVRSTSPPLWVARFW